MHPIRESVGILAIVGGFKLAWQFRTLTDLKQLRRPLSDLLAACGILWGVIELSSSLSATLRDFWGQNGGYTILFLFIILIYYILKSLLVIKEVNFKLANTQILITIKFGNLFEEDGDFWVPVNEFFDSELGDLVSTKSVHGDFIASFLKGNSNEFAKLTSEALQEFSSETLPRTRGRNRKYKIGTTARLKFGSRNVFLTSFTNTDIETNKSSADLPMVWTAILAGMKASHSYGGGNRLLMPLIGAGRSGVNIEPKRLLSILIEGIKAGSTNFSQPITIVLHQSFLGEIDLTSIKKDWV